MRAIFRFCIFPVIVLGSLLIIAERLLFDKDSDVLTNPEFVDYRNAEDSLVFTTSDTLPANVTVHNLAMNEYLDTLIKRNCSLPGAGLRHVSRNYHKPKALNKHCFSKIDSSSPKSDLVNRDTGVKDRQVHGIKKTHCDTNRAAKWNALLKKDALAYSDKTDLNMPCLSDTFDNYIVPLPNAIFDDMHHTVKNKVEPSSDFYLYPNPAADKLIIAARNWENIKSLQLFTIDGKLVYKAEILQNEIDIGNLTNGMYVLIIANKSGSQNSRKIVINKE